MAKLCQTPAPESWLRVSIYIRVAGLAVDWATAVAGRLQGIRRATGEYPKGSRNAEEAPKLQFGRDIASFDDPETAFYLRDLYLRIGVLVAARPWVEGHSRGTICSQPLNHF